MVDPSRRLLHSTILHKRCGTANNKWRVAITSSNCFCIQHLQISNCYQFSDSRYFELFKILLETSFKMFSHLSKNLWRFQSSVVQVMLTRHFWPKIIWLLNFKVVICQCTSLSLWFSDLWNIGQINFLKIAWINFHILPMLFSLIYGNCCKCRNSMHVW